MVPTRRPNDAVHLFMSELTSRVVAASGIPSDRFHLGKIILQSLKDAPNSIMQIDGATGLSDTNETVLKKSVRCAISMKNYGLQCGDVIVIMAPNQLDVAAPFYGALYLGVAIAGVDRTLGVGELRRTFDISKPKIIFCQSERACDVQQALNDLNFDCSIVTFNKGNSFCTLSQFFERYGGTENTDVERFTPTNFNSEDNIALAISTSGTTGCSKLTAATHKNMVISLPYVMAKYTNFPTPTKMALNLSPLQWLSAIIHFVMSPILRYTQLITSEIFTTEHAYHLINTYQPTFLILTPTLMTTLITQTNRDHCNFTSLEILLLGGSAVSKELIEEVKVFGTRIVHNSVHKTASKMVEPVLDLLNYEARSVPYRGLLKRVTPETEVLNVYGMSEICGMSFVIDYTLPGSSGKPLGILQYRIVNVDTQQDINEPNITGELWVKGPGIFKEYLNNPEETAEIFAEDRWLKTGDLFYRDENWNFFFVERLKLLLKYKNNQISPVEVENIIRQHPGISDVAVTGIPDPECGELPVACVILREGAQVTADEIKELVKKNLSDAKQLRGGVVFLNELPLTATSKINRKKLRDMVPEMERL